MQKEVTAIIENADALADAQDLEGAVAKIEAGLEKYPNTKSLQDKLDEYNKILTEQRAAVIAADADSLASSGRLDEAAQMVENGLAAYPENTTLQTKLEEYNVSLAEIASMIENADALADAEDFEGAIAKIQAGLKKYPDTKTLKDKLEEYNQAFTEYQIAAIVADADALASEGGLNKAIEMLENGLAAYPESTALQSRLQEYHASLAAQVKAKTLADAKALADANEYKAAMAVIQAAQETYGSDQEYEEAYIQYQKAFALTAAETYAASGDYPNAITTIAKAQKNNSQDVDLIAAYNSYSSSYVTEIVAEADSLMSERNYSAAAKAVDKGLKLLPGNQSLTDKLTEINSSKPVSLANLPAFNGGWEWNNSAPTDPFGNDYSSAGNYVVFYNENLYGFKGSLSGRADGYVQIFAEYRTAGEYNILTMQLAPYSMIGQDGKAFVQVYADDAVVYTSPTITQKTEAFVCEADISGAEYIKVLVNIYNRGTYIHEDDGAVIISDVFLWPN